MKTELFFSPVRPSATLIRHEDGAFRKRSSNQKNLKTLAFRFRVDGKHSEKTELFENDEVAIIMMFPALSPPQRLKGFYIADLYNERLNLCGGPAEERVPRPSFPQT